MDSSGITHWVEQALIEAWAAPSAPTLQFENEEPWYSSYGIQKERKLMQANWKRGYVNNEYDPTHGMVYYYNEKTKCSQWDCPPEFDAEKDCPDPIGAVNVSTEQIRTERWLAGDLDDQQSAGNAINRCVDLLRSRGDDAFALSLVVKNCEVAPERLLASRSVITGRPLIVEAARIGAATCVALLIDAWDAEVDICASSDLGTALHYAAWNGHSIAVETLLMRGASTTLLNKWDETPAQSARSQGHEQCANLIDESEMCKLVVKQSDPSEAKHHFENQKAEKTKTYNHVHEYVKTLEVMVVATKTKVLVGSSFKLHIEKTLIDEVMVLLRIGRATSNNIVLSELLVSKVHAIIGWLPSCGKVAIQDQGSQRGISVRGKHYRPKKHKQERVCSKWEELNIGDEFSIGSTTMRLVQPSNRTGKAMTPGVISKLRSSSFIPNEKSLELLAEQNLRARKEEAKRAKKELMEHHRCIKTAEKELMPPPPPKICIKQNPQGGEDFGRSMLAKLGWEAGKGLGKDAHGITEPITVPLTQYRAGIGTSSPSISSKESDLRAKRKLEKKEGVWKAAKARFEGIRPLTE